MNTITTAVTVLAAEGGHHVVNELIFPAWVFGVGAFVLFLLLLAATMSLRSVSLRHDVPAHDDYHAGRGYDERQHSHWGGH
ncbi:hypothetical protein E7744_08825 [Citricoccus sp. SGAir0253]|uniref:hypothetical protein n=1 Tax=Citricoccus sp. SGAir0253 TaxID=2567881 RepID=UPI0010CD3B0F|nr:hypothetical protein [Citricoccus sp. SGAir0253]QCU78263.1 hypothetical protein E7744_08825 [Citricoccus sp. SGAir0253]